MHLFGIGRRRARALPVRRRARALSVHPKLWINGEAQPPHWYRGLGTSGEALALTRLLITKLMLILNWAMLLVTTIGVLSSCIHMMLVHLSAMLFSPITKRFVLSSCITSLLSTMKLVSKPVCGESSEVGVFLVFWPANKWKKFLLKPRHIYRIDLSSLPIDSEL